MTLALVLCGLLVFGLVAFAAAFGFACWVAGSDLPW